jgi:protein O-GlcNAc transferase
MAQNAPGRNDPCPCGSGKKYKKCCQATEPVARDTAPAPQKWRELPLAERVQIAEEVERLDQLSNGAVDAIQAKRFEEAERICEELLREYPQVFDGHDRLAMLREAQGRFQEAADHYSKALALMEAEPGSCDPALIENFRRRRQDALARVRQP